MEKLGTYKGALKIAKEWLKRMHKDGFTEVTLLDKVTEEDRTWVFTFYHTVTGKTANLETHGLTKAEREKIWWRPSVYWNGSSTAEPQMKDFLPKGWKCKYHYYKDGTN